MSRSTLRWVIILTTIATAFIHLVVLPLRMGRPDLPFILNGIGFLSLLAALFFVKVPFLAGRETLLHYAYMAFTAITLIAYFVVQGGNAFTDTLGLVTKAIEVVLLIALFLHLRAEA
jgi:hypothetical protein